MRKVPTTEGNTLQLNLIRRPDAQTNTLDAQKNTPFSTETQETAL